MKIKFILNIYILSIFFISCKDNIEWKNPSQCDYIKEKGAIKLNEELYYDIIPEVALSTEIGEKIKPVVNFKIFNYGNDLRVNDGALENIYSDGLAPLIHLYTLEPSDIKITNEFENDLYGKWGEGKVSIPEFGKNYENVFISPLAYQKIKGTISRNLYLILVRFISVNLNKSLVGVFVGDHKSAYIIDNNYSQIITKQTINFTGKNLSPFWKAILPEEVHKNYLRLNGSELKDNKIFNLNHFDEFIRR